MLYGVFNGSHIRCKTQPAIRIENPFPGHYAGFRSRFSSEEAVRRIALSGKALYKVEIFLICRLAKFQRLVYLYRDKMESPLDLKI